MVYQSVRNSATCDIYVQEYVFKHCYLISPLYVKKVYNDAPLGQTNFTSRYCITELHHTSEMPS